MVSYNKLGSCPRGILLISRGGRFGQILDQHYSFIYNGAPHRAILLKNVETGFSGHVLFVQASFGYFWIVV